LLSDTYPDQTSFYLLPEWWSVVSTITMWTFLSVHGINNIIVTHFILSYIVRSYAEV